MIPVVLVLVMTMMMMVVVVVVVEFEQVVVFGGDVDGRGRRVGVGEEGKWRVLMKHLQSAIQLISLNM